MKNNEKKNINAKEVSTLAKMFGVDFTEEDTQQLQSWIDEENSEVNQP